METVDHHLMAISVIAYFSLMIQNAHLLWAPDVLDHTVLVATTLVQHV